MKNLVTKFYNDNREYVIDPKTARQKAMEAMMTYGAILVEKGMREQYGVSVDLIRNEPGRPWGLYVESIEEEVNVTAGTSTPVY